MNSFLSIVSSALHGLVCLTLTDMSVACFDTKWSKSQSAAYCTWCPRDRHAILSFFVEQVHHEIAVRRVAFAHVIVLARILVLHCHICRELAHLSCFVPHGFVLFLVFLPHLSSFRRGQLHVDGAFLFRHACFFHLHPRVDVLVDQRVLVYLHVRRARTP
jgi:hypothetical protein